MKSRYSSRLGTAVTMALPLVVSCQSTPTHLLTLEPVAPATLSSAHDGPPIRVDAVHLPPALDRAEVVGSQGPGGLMIYDFDQWSAPLGQLARQTLAEDLLRRLPAARIIFPYLPKPDGALGLTVDVLDMRVDETGVHLDASWLLTPSGANASASGHGGTVSLRTAAPTVGAAGTAKALSALLGQLADRIVATL